MNSGSNPPNPQDGSHSLSTGDDESDSPCIGICTTLYDEVCQGCGRTLNEVSNWVFFSDEEKALGYRMLFDGVSTKNILVFGVTAAFHSSISVRETKVTSKPHRLRILLNNCTLVPKILREATI